MGWTVAGMGTQHSDTLGKRPHCLAVGRCRKDGLQLLTLLGSASVSSWDHIWKATLKQWLDAKEVLRAWMFHPNFNKQPFLWSFLRCWESLCNFGIKSLTLQYSCLENPLDRGTWWATVHEVMETDTTERLTHTHNWGDTWWCKGTLYLLSHLLQEAGWGRQHLGGRMAHPHPPSLLEVLGPQCLQQLALGK